MISFFSGRRVEFNPRAVHLVLAAEKSGIWIVYIQLLRFSFVIIISQVVHTRFHSSTTDEVTQFHRELNTSHNKAGEVFEYSRPFCCSLFFCQKGNYEEPHFTQDGAPLYFTLPINMSYENNFPGRWIGRRGPREWPPRCPDLIPRNFHGVGPKRMKSTDQNQAYMMNLNKKIGDVFMMFLFIS
jgi:hypothetical protein